MFIVAIDPLLRRLEHYLPNPYRGIVRACVDNIAMAISSLFHLPGIARIFQLARRASGLALKLHKCRFVPLRPWRRQLIESFRDWLL